MVTLATMRCSCAVASPFAGRTSSYADAVHVLHEYYYLCCRFLLELWNLLEICSYAMYYTCNSCCRENLAQPVINDYRQLVRSGGWWTVVVVRLQDRR